jgi:glycerophosphoryl diester phosphodiesterase
MIVIGHRGASGYRPLAELLDAHSQPYSPPLPLAAIVEEPER